MNLDLEYHLFTESYTKKSDLEICKMIPILLGT